VNVCLIYVFSTLARKIWIFNAVIRREGVMREKLQLIGQFDQHKISHISKCHTREVVRSRPYSACRLQGPNLLSIFEVLLPLASPLWVRKILGRSMIQWTILSNVHDVTPVYASSDDNTNWPSNKRVVYGSNVNDVAPEATRRVEEWSLNGQR